MTGENNLPPQDDPLARHTGNGDEHQNDLFIRPRIRFHIDRDWKATVHCEDLDVWFPFPAELRELPYDEAYAAIERELDRQGYSQEQRDAIMRSIRATGWLRIDFDGKWEFVASWAESLGILPSLVDTEKGMVVGPPKPQHPRHDGDGGS